MYKFVFFTVTSVLVASAAEEQNMEKAVEALEHHVHKGRLRQEVEHEQVLSGHSKAQRQLLEEERKESEANRKQLHQQVQQLEANLAFQQQQAGLAQEQHAYMLRSLRAMRQQAEDLLHQQAVEADKATRRLCEALTQGRGNMRLLCRGARIDMSPTLAKVLQWLARQQGKPKSRSSRTSWTLIKIAAVWHGWLVITILLWRMDQLDRKTKTN
ncbi:hypothetical protein E2C01_096593 [Portunus trituberculatus]|uniref:Uncharacterized protein n=1 Tax=Portunus trituberculatus TaxID=210409 RepID=A0A5B7JW12_PORTR|nr:hypothetical protein [Portunus trituberculatus]